MEIKNLFFYWTGFEYNLISILRRLIIRHSKNETKYNAVFVNDDNLSEFVEDLPIAFKSLEPAFKADFLRVYLVTKYGGIWIDADTLVMSDLSQLFSIFEEKSGFFIAEDNQKICNGVFGSKPDTELMKNWLEYTYRIINDKTEIQWGELGFYFLTQQFVENNSIFSDYLVFDGNATMFPVRWHIAEEIYCSSAYNYSMIKTDFQPLIILVNSVYKAVENNPRLLKNTLLAELLEMSDKNCLDQESAREAVFSEIYRTNAWAATESRSGAGSTLHATRHLRRELPLLFERYSIRSVLDIPCGDFNWMSHVDLKNIDCTGADVVAELIQQNRAWYPTVNFKTLDLVNDPLPRVDLIFCRDCLFHLPYIEISHAIANMKRSGAKYLLTTSNTWRSHTNTDIERGKWRKLNLELAPFNFPRPLEIIIEGCEEGDGFAADKSMCLWDLDSISDRLLEHGHDPDSGNASIYVISLARSGERRALFASRNSHLKFDFFDAVDGSSLDVARLVESGIFEADLPYTPGAYGCAISHLTLLERAAAGERPLTIAEDDAIFRLDFEEQYRAVMASLPADWDIVVWGWNFDSILSLNAMPDVSPGVMVFSQDELRKTIDAFQEMRSKPGVMRLDKCFGTVAYTISPSGARKFKARCFPLSKFMLYFPLLNRELPNNGIDIAFNRIYCSTSSYVAFPPLVVTENIHSISTVQS